MKNPNGFGSVVKLSGNRRKPFEVRVNTRMDERYYPIYDVLGRYEKREDAIVALAKYNEKPYDLDNRSMTFSKLYDLYYYFKYEQSGKEYSKSSKNCTKTAYNFCNDLYDRPYYLLRTDDFRKVLNQ